MEAYQAQAWSRPETSWHSQEWPATWAQEWSWHSWSEGYSSWTPNRPETRHEEETTDLQAPALKFDPDLAKAIRLAQRLIVTATDLAGQLADLAEQLNVVVCKSARLPDVPVWEPPPRESVAPDLLDKVPAWPRQRDMAWRSSWSSSSPREWKSWTPQTEASEDVVPKPKDVVDF